MHLRLLRPLLLQICITAKRQAEHMVMIPRQSRPLREIQIHLREHQSAHRRRIGKLRLLQHTLHILLAIPLHPRAQGRAEAHVIRIPQHLKHSDQFAELLLRKLLGKHHAR